MNPIFEPSVHIDIPAYLTLMSLAFSVAVVYFYKRAIRLHLSPKLSTEISMIGMVGAFVGARLFHILFEYPEHYIQNPFDIFKIQNGGFVFYGGFIVGLAASLYYIKRLRQNPLSWLDCAAPAIAVGYIIGRIGCVFAGCCYGKICNLPWAISFPIGVEAPAHIPLHPTQFYSIIGQTIVLTTILLIEKYKTPKMAGTLFFLWLLGHGISRLIVEQFRGDFRGDLFGATSISTIISIILIGFSLYKVRRL